VVLARTPSSKIKGYLSGLIAALSILLGSCAGPLRLINLPFDASGRSVNSPFAEQNPRLAGRYLTFVSDRRGSQDIYLYDTVTQRLLPLPGLNAPDLLAESPGISQDGRWLVFRGVRQGRSDIYLYNVETRQLRNLSQNLAAVVRNPTISADGTRIAFEASTNGQWDILVYDRSGRPLNLPTAPR